MEGAAIQHVLLDHCPHQARTLLELSGADVARFLQGLLSADIDALARGAAVPATLLSVKGKIISELIVLRGDGGELSLLAPRERVDEVAQLLDRHIIMDDVAIQRRDDIAVALVFRPGASEAPELALDAGVAGYRTIHPAPGLLVLGDPSALARLGGGAPEAAPEVFTRHRVATAAPAWGFEITPDKFPPEVGFVEAVSYSKGCYMGQEPLARIHARGQVNRVMVRVRATTAVLPGAEGPVELDDIDRSGIGRWTTWVHDDRDVIGLAIVHRKRAVVGARLSAGELGEVEVTSGPLGDDLGVGDRHTKA
ncbi:MAG: hypothetical protein KC636_11475 [Myxococcales bacterium]|nr:hypothetical protein [Myxococcales bacterium]